MSDIGNGQNSPRSRPQFAPLGPRTRLRTGAIDSLGSAISPQDTPTFGAMNPTTPVKPLPTPPKPLPPVCLSYPRSASSTVTFLDSPPDPDDSGSNQLMASGALAALYTNRPSSLTPSDHSMQGKYLPFVNKELTSPIPAPYHYSNYIQPDIETTSRTSSSRVPQSPPKLTPPPPITFESVTIPWKGMQLEPALWTFNSTELQNIVSRAIRLSANESFLRLLTIENLDKILPAELERLNQLKTTTQAQYRFLVQRRTMLFHALNTSSFGPQNAEENEFLVNKLTAQLAETITDCDQRLEELFRINDQVAQVNQLLDVHSSSALAVALRKLNSSYAHRTRDLNKAHQRIFQLEAEIEDAWKEAEKLADELDEYEASADDAVIERAEIVAVPRSPSQSPPPLTNVDRRGSLPMPVTPTLLAVKSISPLSPTLVESSNSRPSATVPLVGINFVFPPPVPKDKPNDDVVSIRSSKSVKSVKSTKSTKSTKSYASSLHAAKKRSTRASRNSLRLSIGSGSCHGRGGEDVPPPMPDIPLHFINAPHGTVAKNGGKSGNELSTNSSSTPLLLFYATGSRLARDSNGSLSLRRVKKQTSLDTLSANNRRSAAMDAYRGKAMDDIYVDSHGHFSSLQSSKNPYPSDNPYVDLSWDDDSEIQAVPRTPPFRPRTISGPVMDIRHTQHSDIPPLPPPKDNLQTLPSAWKNVKHMRRPQTAPLPELPELGVLCQPVPAQNAAASTNKPGLLRTSKTLHKIKGFTKRYSASIPPIFNGKPSLRKIR